MLQTGVNYHSSMQIKRICVITLTARRERQYCSAALFSSNLTDIRWWPLMLQEKAKNTLVLTKEQFNKVVTSVLIITFATPDTYSTILLWLLFTAFLYEILMYRVEWGVLGEVSAGMNKGKVFRHVLTGVHLRSLSTSHIDVIAQTPQPLPALDLVHWTDRSF